MSLSPINNYASYAASIPTVVPSTPATAAAPTALVRTAAPVAPVTQAIAAAKDAAPIPTATQVDDHAKLDKAIESINRFLKPVNSNIEFSIDKDSGRTIVQVIDTDTKDVLRQFPSKEALAISHELDKFQGLLVRDKA